MRYKLVVFVPVSHADAVREAMHAAGGGRMDSYSHCSFSSRGIGRFRPEEGAEPAIGEVGKLEQVEEERIEILLDESVARAAIDAMKKVHPYEVPAYELYELAQL